MKTLFQECLDVSNENYQDWDTAAKNCVDTIFNFSDQCGNKHMLDVVNDVDFYVKDNPHLIPAALLNNSGHSQYTEFLKSLIDYYIHSGMNAIDPAEMRFSATQSDLEDSIQIHQAWFLLASHSAISLFSRLIEDPAYSQFVNTMMSKSLVTATVIKKQHDYGPENIAKFGMWGLIVRLHDKIARLDNLLSTKRKGFNSVSDETIYDTLLDVVGYSTVALLWINNWFLLPMKLDKND
jgi:hypothetical protein